MFNDDKKTDLIGEAWIDLTTVVVLGGGQNDLWHQLHFKGKYAGDVRMELTYYDTRPKEVSLSGKRPDKERLENGRGATRSNDGSGPRRLGPRDVKRRPLPAEPVVPAVAERLSPPEQVHSAPLPLSRSNGSLQISAEEYDAQWAPDSQYHAYNGDENAHYTELPSTSGWDHNLPPNHGEHPQHHEAMEAACQGQPLSNNSNMSSPSDRPDSDAFSYHSARSSLPITPLQPYAQASSADERRRLTYHSHSSPTPSSPYSLPPAYGPPPPATGYEQAFPGSSDTQNRDALRRYSTSPIKSDVFRDSPLRHSMSQNDVDPLFARHDEVSDEEGPPPPPPAHRTNVQPLNSPPESAPDMQPVQVPEPLNLILSNRQLAPFDRSPLQQIEKSYDPSYQEIILTNRVATTNEREYLPYSRPVYTPHDQQATEKPSEKPLKGIESTPSILRSGHGRGQEGTYEPWLRREAPSERRSIGHEALPGNLREIMPGDSGSCYQTPHVEDEQPALASESAMVRPRAMSSDSRSAPKRKAVTPQPTLESGEQSISSVPFGPDSYDVFNPSSPLSASVVGPESRYETPEQAMEAARQHEVQKLRDVGPIIGNDGRVIDPSDHLPTDTWAPEPERKSRKPEMVIRYRTKDNHPRTPQGHASSPGSARPHSVAGPFFGSSPLAVESPTDSLQQTHMHNRLHKQIAGRPLPGQPYLHSHSSPVVPASVPNTPSPRTGYSPRPALSEYSVHGHRHQGNSHGGSPEGRYGGAPPVPAKIPISPLAPHDQYGGYGGMDALSAELSTIDIGTSPGLRGNRLRREYEL